MAGSPKRREQIMAKRREQMGLMAQPDGKPRRRRAGEGTIRFKSGAWEITLRAYKGAPQEPWTRLRGFSLAEAEAELDRRAALVRAGAYVSRAQPQTVKQLWDDYRLDHERLVRAGNIGQATLDDRTSMMKAHILPAIGADMLQSFNGDVLLEYIAAKREGADMPRSKGSKAQLSPRSINKHIELIGMMFRWGMHRDRRYVTRDPTEDLERLDVDSEETEPYEPAHVQALLTLLPAGTERRIAAFVLATGCRLGEALGVQQTSCEEKTKTIKFRHAIKREGGRSLLGARGKNRAATRDFKHGEEMALLIRDQKAENATLPQRCSNLFRTPSGTQWNPSNFRNRCWLPAIYAGYVKDGVIGDDLRELWLQRVPADLRDAAILLTLDMVTVHAVLDARWEQLSGNRLTFEDADGRERVCVLPAETAGRLEARRLTATDRRIFPGKKRQRIGLATFIDTVFRDPLKAAGIDFDRRIHRARHTFVSLTGAIEPDLPQKQLQRRIGHSNEASTRTYMHTFRAHAERPGDVLPFLELGVLPHTEEVRRRRAAELMGISPEVLARAVQAVASEQGSIT